MLTLRTEGVTDAWVDAGFLCGKSAVPGDRITVTLYARYALWLPNRTLITFSRKQYVNDFSAGRDISFGIWFVNSARLDDSSWVWIPCETQGIRACNSPRSSLGYSQASPLFPTPKFPTSKTKVELWGSGEMSPVLRLSKLACGLLMYEIYRMTQRLFDPQMYNFSYIVMWILRHAVRLWYTAPCPIFFRPSCPRFVLNNLEQGSDLERSTWKDRKWSWPN